MPNSNILYLAYGSNLHPIRITERIPSASFVGTTHLPGLALTFHKRSEDGSGKCTFAEQGNGDAGLWCAVYALAPRDKERLDRIEGLGQGYDEQQVDFRLDGMARVGSIYYAASTHVDPRLLPYHWYREMVLLGAHYHGFPEDYTRAVAGVGCVDDPDRSRNAENESLLEKMRVSAHRGTRDGGFK